MRILRVRPGFQADHSSSSYLFYAVDRPVSARGQQIAHRFSSRAEVDEQTARYLKWGESDLNPSAYEALLGKHYDLMVSESYDWWTLMIAVPKTAAMRAALTPFFDARGDDDQGVEVEEYGSHLVITVYCSFDYSGPVLEYGEDPLESLADLLVEIRGEILQGNLSFLQAVSSFYGGDASDEEEEADEEPAAKMTSVPPNLSKAELQRACQTRGIPFRKSWNKDQLRAALAERSRPAGRKPARQPLAGRKRTPRLSKAAQQIVASLDRP